MPAAVVDRPGAQLRIGFVVLPSRAPGTTLVDVHAAPLNPLDLVIASGGFHSARHEDPYVPGSECVGTVVESDRLTAGTWVYAECDASPARPGSFATQVVVPDDRLLPLPPGLDPVTAAAVGNSGTAAFLPLVERAGLRPGETVLVLGATGAVGQLAVQVARRCGAGRVVGVGRDREALDRLLDLGADAVLDLRPDESERGLVDRLTAAAGPVDVVLDGLFGVPLQAALGVCAPGARVVNIGNPAGATAQLPAGLLRGRQLTVSGFAGLHTPLRDKTAALTWLWASLGRAELRIDVRTCELDELPAVWRAQAESPHVKYVVVHDQVSPAQPTTAQSAHVTPAKPVSGAESRVVTTPDNLDADNITATVLSQIDAPDPRVGRLAAALVSHVHAFIRENDVTWEEWMAGLEFLARAGQWTSPTRNEFVLLSDTSGSSTLVDALNNSGPPTMTPTTVEGPFHSPAPPRRMGDVIATEEQWDRGDWTLMHGRVLDTDGNPVAGARIDIWQADQVGNYDVQDDGMQPGDLRALLTTGPDGGYWFRTVKPCSYPVPTDGPGGDWLRATGRQPMRPAHIHARVDAEGHRPLITHLFVAGDPYLDVDAAFGVRKGLILDFALRNDPSDVEAAEMPGPYFDVPYDLVLVPDTWSPRLAEAAP